MFPWQITHMQTICHCQLGALAPIFFLRWVGLEPAMKPSWRITGSSQKCKNNTTTWVCLKICEHLVSTNFPNLIVYHGFWSFSPLERSFEGKKNTSVHSHLKATFQHQEKHHVSAGRRFSLPFWGRWKSSWRPLLSQWRPVFSSGKRWEMEIS